LHQFASPLSQAPLSSRSPPLAAAATRNELTPPTRLISIHVIAGGFDLVIRLGRLDDSDLLSRQLESIDMRLVASPDYLKHAGTPHTVAELANHRGILTRIDLDHWTIDDQSIRVLWHLCNGNMIVTFDAVCAGLGIAMVPGFMADGLIAKGRLVRILPKNRFQQLEVTALQARSVTPSVGVKALLAHLENVAGRPPHKLINPFPRRIKICRDHKGAESRATSSTKPPPTAAR
jgi:DNA-binding transcriptional LysR family regulator